MAKAKANAKAASRRNGRKASKKTGRKRQRPAARMDTAPIEPGDIMLEARIVLRKSELSTLMLEWLAHEQTRVMATRSRPEGGPLMDSVPC